MQVSDDEEAQEEEDIKDILSLFSGEIVLKKS